MEVRWSASGPALGSSGGVQSGARSIWWSVVSDTREHITLLCLSLRPSEISIPGIRLESVCANREPDHVVESITGHLSRRMLEHYSHIRLTVKRTALDGISSARGTYVTSHDTTGTKSRDELPEVIENMVELVGIEPTASSLRTTRSPS